MISVILNNIITFLLSHKLIIVLIGYIVLLSTSGKVLIFVLSKVKHEKSNAQTKLFSFDSKREKITFANKTEMDTGFIIGKCENVLILTLVLFNAYTALALIFGAKTIIREEEIKNNSLYFLAGTMINVTYSIIIGLTVKYIISL